MTAAPIGSRPAVRCGSRSLDLAAPAIMGVLNLTPDSFSDGGRFWRGTPDVAAARAAAEGMIAAGAAVLDVGGESTRPGAPAVDWQEECRRVIPVLEALADLDIVLSVDTRKPEVAQRAIAAGACLINDVGGFREPGMLEVLAGSGAGGCIMHMQGEPRTMQHAPAYRDVVGEVRAFFADRVAACAAAGVAPERLLLDPGIGFGKTLEHNLALLTNLERLRIGTIPLLVGVSRKRMIGAITGRELPDRLVGSVAAALLAVQRGADLVRVHDVAETADALRMLAAFGS